MKQIELTSKLVLVIIGLTSVSAILVPTYAVPSIKSADIVNESILSEDIKNGEVKTVDLASDAVTLVVIERLSGTLFLSPGESGRITAECNDDEVVTGGGFAVGGANEIFVRASTVQGNGWGVSAINTSTATDGDVGAFAECAKLIP
jgi:hypothetical protein